MLSLYGLGAVMYIEFGKEETITVTTPVIINLNYNQKRHP
jgi:hypothetical protein